MSVKIIGTVDRDAAGRAIVRCHCDCGNFFRAYRHNVESGHTKSCGCLKRKGTRTRHGEASGRTMSAEYRVWVDIKQRCTNPRRKGYQYWGGMGVRICERWLNSFENFLADMGRRPSASHSIDRFPNKHGDYEPGNCRWATRSEQSRNRRRTNGWKIKSREKAGTLV